MGLGMEKLDRDAFDPERVYDKVAALGVKWIRLQSGWQKAEKAEFAKTEFFANVGSELCDPLKDLSAKIFQMQGNIEKGIVDQDILTEQLIFLRSQIQSQLHKTVTLVELTRSQVDDLPMDKKLFDIRQVLPGSVVASLNQKFPLVYGDPDRLKKALLTFFGDGKGTM